MTETDRSPGKFSGRTVAITGVGGAGQVGATLARAFMDAGATVILIGRTAGEIALRAGELADFGDEPAHFSADLADPVQADALAAAVKRAAPDGLDALVHAAGGFAATGPVADTAPDDWQRQLTINLTTAFLTVRALLPLLRQRRGAIVCFSSAAAVGGATGANIAAYAAAKSGLIALVRAVAAEEAGHGVRANAVAPTAIETAANARGGMKGAVSLASVAGAVMHLASDDSAAITGQVIRLGQ